MSYSYSQAQTPYGATNQDNEQYQAAAYAQPGPDMNGLAAQVGGMGISDGAARGHKKKRHGGHAYHELNQNSPQPGMPMSPPAPQQFMNQQPGFGRATQPQQSPAGFNAPTFGQPVNGFQASQAPAQTAIPTSAQGRVDPNQIPSVPMSRDGPAQWYLEHVYATMDQHQPPPASVPYVAIDQGNASPKFARLTLNNIPFSSEALNATSIPLGMILQPLAAQQDGEQPVPVVDFGEIGPPRCRRCRTYVNPFMQFKAGGNKMQCNMCTFPNDVTPEYFAPTDMNGGRIDRLQRPELSVGTIDFVAPKEYWTREPVPLRYMFLIDVSMEAVTRKFLTAICQGILNTLYGETWRDDPVQSAGAPTQKDTAETNLPKGSRIGFATFDRAVHFYNLHPKMSKPHMVVMPDLEDPFVPLSEGLFVDPIESKSQIISLISTLPDMFEQIKSPEPALLPALTACLDALKATGGKIVCSLAALSSWGPGRLVMREKQEMRDTDTEKKLFSTDHPQFTKLATGMTEAGVGADFFLASPQGGYLDLATIGHVAEKTGGEIFYYPNYHTPRDDLKISKEIKRTLTRDTGFQALMKVRCSNGLQVANYFGNFTQHTLGADLEFGVIDSDKAFGVQFSYDGKLDSKQDAHFQGALLYTSAAGQRRIRCINVVASVSEGANESMKTVDQDAIVTLLAKQAAVNMTGKMLKDVRAAITERTVDILASYRKNFSGSHPPGQLVLPENLKEFHMYMLGLLKSRALKAGHEPTDRRVHEMRLLKHMGAMDTSLFLYPRIIGIHNLEDLDGFPNENGHLRMPAGVRASYSRLDEGGVYLVDNGQVVLLWLHAQVSPNLLEDLYGQGYDSLKQLNPFSATIPVLETHLNAQVRNICQYLEDNRGSKAMAIQLARQGMDGAEYDFARLLYEDRNNEAQSCVDWLVHVHRHIQLELQGQRKKEEGENMITSLTGMKAPYWN